ncbi:guanylate kinase, partial [uncultured Alistipes sp.]
VYAGCCYGTLRSEVERIWAKGNVILFDVDVVGGLNLKRIFGDEALAVFIMPPSVEELRRRLAGRGTDDPEVIERRVAKAASEIARAPEFDHVVVNDRLEDAIRETTDILNRFIR